MLSQVPVHEKKAPAVGERIVEDAGERPEVERLVLDEALSRLQVDGRELPAGREELVGVLEVDAVVLLGERSDLAVTGSEA